MGCPTAEATQAAATEAAMPPPPPRSGTDVCVRTNARGSDRGVRQELAASPKEKPRVRRGLSLGVFQHYNSSVSAWCDPSMTDYEKVAGRVPLSPFLFAPILRCSGGASKVFILKWSTLRLCRWQLVRQHRAVNSSNAATRL